MIRPFRLLPLCLLLFAACSAAPAATGPASATPSAPGPSLALASEQPTVNSQAPATGTLYSGVLSMDAIEGGCAYLQSADGRKLQVIYPDGWQLDKSPLELIAPDGSVHSKGGDRVAVRGSEADDMASICQIGPIILATEVLGK